MNRKDFFISLDSLQHPAETLPKLTDSANLLFGLVRQITEYCVEPSLLERQAASDTRIVIGSDSEITFTHQTSLGNVQRLGNFVTVAEGAKIADDVVLEHGSSVGECSHIETGVIIRIGASIGKHAEIGEGSEINYDLPIPDGAIVGAHKLITSVDQITSI